MSVVGFDFGNQNCYTAVARQGGIEVITNEYSLHSTPAYAAFTPKKRIFGVAARQQISTNVKNTIINFKHLIGRTFTDPITQEERKWIPVEMVQLPNDAVGLKVNYLGETRVFTPEQVTSMMLYKLKTVTEQSMRAASDPYARVTDCVVSVPCFYTDSQRRSLLECTRVAGINCLRILNETTAVALAYGIYKQDLPVENEKARTVVFIDCGHAATQAALVQFSKGKLQVKGTTYDIGLGGREFDDVLRNHMLAEFKQRYKIDCSTNTRAWVRLLDGCEKMKKEMSANSTPIPLNIECLMDDKDVTAQFARADFEALCEPLLDRFRRVLKKLLDDSKMKPDQIDVVEIVGGSSRIPMLKDIIQEVFGKEPSTTMNMDEAVSRGCAMQCAILSPKFRVREFSVADAQPFRIKLNWDPPVSGGEGGEQDVFEENHPFPFSKMLTMFRREQFTLSASYSLPNTVPSPKREIGDFTINNVVPNEQGEARKVKIKVRINPNGIFSVSSASMVDKVPAVEEVAENEQATAENGPTQEAMDTASQPENGNGEATEETERDEADQERDAGASGDTPPNDGATADTAKASKTKTISIDLPITERVLGPDKKEVEQFIDMELAMQRHDLDESEKSDAKNKLEEYVYDMREKLSTSLQKFITPNDAASFNTLLNHTEEWLYDDGEDVAKDIYNNKFAELNALGDPVVERCQEFSGRNSAFNALGKTLQTTRKIYEAFLAGKEKYNHLDATDMEKVCKQLEEKQQWLTEMMGKQERRQLTEPPIVFAREIIEQKQQFETICTPIVTKKKPRPPSKEKAPDVNGTDTAKDESAENKEPAGGATTMEVD